MNRRTFIRVFGGGTILSAVPCIQGCSRALPEEAIAAWRGPQNEQDVRKWILSYAILAPHSHNLQSWLVDLRQPNEITLFCDRTRLLPETDPLSRQIMMSQGTFLELLDLAAKERGIKTEIELFPDGEFEGKTPDEHPTARIRLSEDTGVEKDPLFAQIIKRRTNREGYSSKPIPVEAAADIKSATAAFPMRVGAIDAMAVNSTPVLAKHREIAVEAWRIELETPRTALESYKWLRVGPDEIAKHRDGITVNDRLPRIMVSLGLFDRTEAPKPGDYATRDQIDDFTKKIYATNGFFWLISEGNDRKTQVNAGRAYVRAQLAATAHGLSMHPLSQALQEYPEQEKPYAAIHSLLGASQPNQVVQMWTRLGFAPAIEPAPRRELAEHILRE